MRIGKFQQNITFKRALNEAEKREYKTVLRRAKEQVAEGGKSILIVHEPCLPQAKETDTGIGHLTSQTASNFFDFAKNYLGINVIEVLPPGEIQIKGHKGFYNTYNGSALSLGTQGIDLELLTKPEGKSLLSKEDLMDVVRENKDTQKEGFVNYENIIDSDSKHELALKKAFDKYKNTDTIDKTDYEIYKKQNRKWLDRKAIYYALKIKNNNTSWHQWPEEEKNLFKNTGENKRKQIENIKNSYSSDIEYYKFKQFLAEQHLQIGRKQLNEKGMKLFGDCLIGFSEDEVWAFQDAFKFDNDGNTVNVGLAEWKMPALNYEEILKEGSPANKLLKMKVGLFARRYDGIRFDCSWSYVTPKLSDGSKFDFKGQILNIIEETVKKVKGESYNQNDIIHEFEASPKDFSLFDNSGHIKSYLKNRVKVISSANMDEKYGTAYAMRKLGMNPDSYIIGVGNHDPQPLRQIADNIPETTDGKTLIRKEGQINILKDIFNVSYNELTSPTDFVRYKFAEPLTAKNNMVFYMDVLGRADRFDSQIENGRQNYRQRIPENYEKAYQDAVESKYGYNPADAYAKVFEKKGLDVKNKELYKKLVKYADILYETPQTSQPKENTETPEQIIGSTDKNTKLKVAGGAALGVGFVALVISLAKKGLSSL